MPAARKKEPNDIDPVSRYKDPQSDILPGLKVFHLALLWRQWMGAQYDRIGRRRKGKAAKEVQCPVCLKEINNIRSDTFRHIEIHFPAELKTFRCTIAGCTYGATCQRGNLLNHIQNKHIGRKLVCGVIVRISNDTDPVYHLCGFTFSDQTALCRHRKKLHKKRNKKLRWSTENRIPIELDEHHDRVLYIPCVNDVLLMAAAAPAPRNEPPPIPLPDVEDGSWRSVTWLEQNQHWLPVIDFTKMFNPHKPKWPQPLPPPLSWGSPSPSPSVSPTTPTTFLSDVEYREPAVYHPDEHAWEPAVAWSGNEYWEQASYRADEHAWSQAAPLYTYPPPAPPPPLPRQPAPLGRLPSFRDAFGDIPSPQYTPPPRSGSPGTAFRPLWVPPSPPHQRYTGSAGILALAGLSIGTDTRSATDEGFHRPGPSTSASSAPRWAAESSRGGHPRYSPYAQAYRLAREY